MQRTTDELATDALQRATQHWPSLVATNRSPRRSIKCVLVPASMDGRAVIVKALTHSGEQTDGPRDASAIWRWYMKREEALLGRFESTPPPVRAPRLLASRAGEGLLVLEELEGEPISAKRHERRGLPRVASSTWAALIGAITKLRAFAPGASIAREVEACVPRDPSIERALERRLLEDPYAGLPWLTNGMAQAHAQGLVDDAALALVTAAAPAPMAFSHGDLLLRNVLRAPEHDDRVAFVDWECAGMYLEGWDPALLYVWAPAEVRATLRETLHPSPERQRAFLACVAFAFVREIAFRRDRGVVSEDTVRARLVDELRDVVEELAARSR